MAASPDASLTRDIESLAATVETPDGRTSRRLPPEAVSTLARDHGLAPRLVEAAALECGVVPERYARNMASLDAVAQARLLRARVVLVGLGGLGGLVLESLARAGVGRLTGCDGDHFEPTNANRQLLATEEDMGRPKAAAAAMRVRRINPSVEFVAVDRFLDEAGFGLVLDGADLAVDALGGLDDRPALERAAAKAGIPLVTAAVAGWSGAVATVLPGSPGPGSLLAGGRGMPPEDVLGTPGPTVHLAASLQCAEALRLLAGQSPALAGKMLLFDLADMTFETMTLEPTMTPGRSASRG